MSFYICKVIGLFCFSQPAWHKLRLCYTRPIAAKLTDNKTLFCHSILTFCRAKSYKNARHKFRKSFKALARELLCNITHPPFTRRLCLNVPISGTKELASRTTNIVWRTRSDTFVLFPLLGLTRAVAQHHAGFVFGITLVCENRRGRPMYLLDIVPLS